MSIRVSIIMGSRSDWETMQHASETLNALGVHHEVRVISAHRTPDLLFEYAEAAVDRGLKVIIAGAGGAAHLPGMTAAKTRVPVLGVPVQSKALNGMDSLLSIAQMPAGIPVGSMAIGRPGAVNAAFSQPPFLPTMTVLSQPHWISIARTKRTRFSPTKIPASNECVLALSAQASLAKCSDLLRANSAIAAASSTPPTTRLLEKLDRSFKPISTIGSPWLCSQTRVTSLHTNSRTFR